MIYWTKPKFIRDEETGMIVGKDGYEIIQETDMGFVPDGDGFEVDMNDIKYKTYIKHPEDYEIIQGVLVKKEN